MTDALVKCTNHGTDAGTPVAAAPQFPAALAPASNAAVATSG